MNQKLALYLMHGLASKLHLYLGWSRAQGALCGVGQEFVDQMVKEGEVKFPYNEEDTIIKNLADVLVKKYDIASSITFEVAKEFPVARAAIMPPYRIFVKKCVFRDMHPLLNKYKTRRDWKRTKTGQDGMYLVCPLMNMVIHAIEDNSDHLAGHCLEATKQEGETCICLVDVFSKEVDVSNFPEQDNPEVYRIK